MVTYYNLRVLFRLYSFHVFIITLVVLLLLSAGIDTTIPELGFLVAPAFEFLALIRKKEKCTCAAVLLILQLSLVTLGGKESEGVSLSPFMDIMKDWVAELTDSFIQ